MELDNVLETLGGYGTYQMLVYFLICLVCLRGAWHPMASVFIGATPTHHCQLNLSGDLVILTPVNDGDQCQLSGNFSNSTVLETDHCQDSWVYNLDHVGSTIVSEWDLVCDQDYLLPLSTSVFMGGVMAGALFISTIADRFGRRPVMCICLALQAVFGFGCAFTNDIISFTCIRFFIGALNQGISLSGYVLVTELFPSRYRTRPGIAIQFFWAVGMMSLAGMAYCLQNWRHLQMIISLPSLVLAASFWLIPESLPWLIANNKIKQVEKTLSRMAKVNKKPFVPDGRIRELFQQSDELNLEARQVEANTIQTNESRAGGNVLEISDSSSPEMSNSMEPVKKSHCYNRIGADESTCAQNDDGSACIVSGTQLLGQSTADETKTYHIFHLFTRPKMAVYTIIICYLWMANSLDYYGISLSTSELAGDPYLNFFIGGLVEVPAYFVCMFALDYFGRRLPLAVFQFIGGFGNICAVVIPSETASGTDLTPYITALAMVGRFGITGSFSTVFLYSSELFPTSIRNGSVGFSSFWDTLGALCAPFVIFSAKAIPQLPQAIFGSMAIIAGALTLILPETLNHPLPQTIEDVENLDRRLPPVCLCKKGNAGEERSSDSPVASC